MAIWESSMLKSPPRTEDVAELVTYLKTTINQVAVMLKDLDFVLNGSLDVKNIRSESLTSKVIQAGAITAEKVDVDQLSAISADMGEITAGIIRGIQIYGSLIATSETLYPRVTLDPSTVAFAVMADENNGVQMPAFDGGVSKIIFLENGNPTTLYNSPTSGFIILADNLATLSGDGVKLDPQSDYVRVPSWSKLYNEASLSTLQSELDEIWAAIAALSSP